MVKVINIDTKTRTIHVSNADGDIKTWRTTESGTHFPIKEGETTKEAFDKFLEKKGKRYYRGSVVHKDTIDGLKKAKEKHNETLAYWEKEASTKHPEKGYDDAVKKELAAQKEYRKRLDKSIADISRDFEIDPEDEQMNKEFEAWKAKQQPAEKERDYWRGPREDEDAYFDRREKTLTEARKLDKVADWFAKAYKGAYGAPTNKDITFDELADGILSGKINDVYEAVGTGESEVREKIFEELSERTGRPYDDFYDAWLHGGQKGTASRKAKAKEDYKKYNKMLDNPNLAPDIRELIVAARDRAKKEAGKIKETDEEIAHRLTRDYPESFGYDD